MNKVSSLTEFRKYYLSEFELYDGEAFITFNIVGMTDCILNTASCTSACIRTNLRRRHNGTLQKRQQKILYGLQTL